MSGAARNADRRPAPALALLAGMALAGAAPAQQPARSWDDTLRRDDANHGSLGPTGPRLFAQELAPAPGLQGRFGLGQTPAELVDPLVLAFFGEPGEIVLAPAGTTWFPSHLEADWTGPGLRVEECKFITASDALVDRVHVVNTSDQPLDLQVRAGGRATPLLERFRSRQQIVDLSPVANLAGGRAARPLSAGDDPVRVPAFTGGLLYDAIGYALPGGGDGETLTLIGLRGGEPGDPARALPEALSLPLPDVGPALTLLHLLCACPVPRDLPAAGSPAGFAFRFDDGSSEQVPWPVRGAAEGDDGAPAPDDEAVRADWRRLRLPGSGEPALQLSYVPPPGRAIEQVTLSKGDDPGIPLLLAATLELLPEDGRLPVLLGEPRLAGAPLALALAGDGFTSAPTSPRGRELLRRVTLPPGGAADLQLVLALDRQPFTSALQALALAEDDQLLEQHVAASEAWFEQQVPGFSCSDALLERAWRYRWYVVRRCLLQPDLPTFTLPVFRSGLGDDWHTAVGTADTPLILDEVRWLADPQYAQGQVRALLMNQAPDGLLRTVRLDGRGDFRAHGVTAAAVRAFAVNGSLQYLREVAPLLERDLLATLEAFDADGDALPAFRPAAGGAEAADVEGPAAAAWTCAGARALADAARRLDDPARAARLDALAERAQQSMLSRQWSEDAGRFVPVNAVDHAPLPSAEISGLLPFALGVVPDAPRYRPALEALLDPRRFASPRGVTVRTRAGAGPVREQAHPVGSASPCGDGAVVRPDVQCLMLEAMARSLRGAGTPAVSPQDFERLLSAYTLSQFEDGDARRPSVRAALDADTGAGLGCRDGFHASYCDLLIRFVGGLVPRLDERIELWPLVTGLQHFRFTGLPSHGRRLDVTWDRPDGRRIYAEAPEGYTLTIDGRQVLNVQELAHVLAD